MKISFFIVVLSIALTYLNATHTLPVDTSTVSAIKTSPTLTSVISNVAPTDLKPELPPVNPATQEGTTS